MSSPLSLLSRTLFRLALPRNSQRLSILIYHRVLGAPDYMRPWEPSVDEFSRQMDLVSQCFSPLHLSDALAKLDSGDLPPRALCVTFDDGYADNEQVALPVLQKFGIPATVFVASDYLDGGIMWNDTIIECCRTTESSQFDLSEFGLPVIELGSSAQRKEAAQFIIGRVKYFTPEERRKVVGFLSASVSALPTDLMMTSEQLRSLHSAGVEIGAHTCSHPILANVEEENALSEIAESKIHLESLLRSPVRYFAYPNGQPNVDYSPLHADMVKSAGFEAALSTHWGVNDKHSDRWQLARFTPWDKSTLKFLARMALNARTVI